MLTPFRRRRHILAHDDAALDVAVLGAGPAGLGVSIALHSLGLRVRAFDRDAIGAAFAAWPREMRLLTPSFPSNGFGHPDLNAIAPGTSPAFSLGVEHPTGLEYRSYLEAVADHFRLDVVVNTTVSAVQPLPDGGFEVGLDDSDVVRARMVVAACGEYGAPRPGTFTGAEHCVHTAAVDSWSELRGERMVVIGGYESGIDAAADLAERGRMVTVLDPEEPWERDGADPSLTLSPATRERLAEAEGSGRLELHGGRVEAVRPERDGYRVSCVDGADLLTATPPLMATGFEPELGPTAGLFDHRPDGYPLLNHTDESTVTPGLFLAGPGVRHDDAVLCFIYKFRTRFPVVAETIARRLRVETKPLDTWREANMWIDDLSCCDGACAC